MGLFARPCTDCDRERGSPREVGRAIGELKALAGDESGRDVQVCTSLVIPRHPRPPGRAFFQAAWVGCTSSSAGGVKDGRSSMPSGSRSACAGVRPLETVALVRALRVIPGDLNLYRYVVNDPLNAADPTGLAECDK